LGIMIKPWGVKEISRAEIGKITSKKIVNKAVGFIIQNHDNKKPVFCRGFLIEFYIDFYV